MSNEISIVDIPHVMEWIGSYLDRRDQASCSLVSKAFHHEFNRLLWRELAFQRLKSFSEFRVDSDRKRVLLHNARWIRRVAIDAQCHVGVLSLLSKACTLLRDLIVSVSRNQQNDMEGVLLLPVIDLITRNTQLRNFSFLRYGDLPNNTLGPLAGALSRCFCLTELVLVFRVVAPPCGWLQSVLQNSPITLKRLMLQWRRLRANNKPGLFAMQKWPESYPHLEIAKLKVELTEQEEHTLFQFLERCPALRDCSVPLMATMQALSNFVDLFGTNRFPFTLTRLDCCKWTEMNERQWGHLLRAMKDHIQSFIIGVDFNAVPTRHFIRDMTKCWSHTLESLSVHHADLISSEDIQLILTTCPKLKKFNCICQWLLWTPQPQQDESNSLPGLKAMLGDKKSDRNDEIATDWVCLELEELELTFSDGRRIFVEEEMLLQQEQSSIRGIEWVYQQLGRLTKLKDLTIGWCSGSTYSKDANLDMSLQRGLEHMKGLKSLRMIDLSYIPKVKIEKDEVEWMLANWPALSTIKGLRHRRHMFEGNTQEPYPITLLSSGRSWLSIS